MSTVENYVANVLAETQKAQNSGATKVVLDSSSVINALTECQQIAQLGPIVKAMNDLALDQSDISLLEDMLDLIGDLVINSDYLAASDEHLFQNFRDLVDRIVRSNLWVEEDDDPNYTEYDYDTEEYNERLSSFRETPEAPEVNAEFSPPRDNGSWIRKILGR